MATPNKKPALIRDEFSKTQKPLFLHAKLNILNRKSHRSVDQGEGGGVHKHLEPIAHHLELFMLSIGLSYPQHLAP